MSTGALHSDPLTELLRRCDQAVAAYQRAYGASVDDIDTVVSLLGHHAQAERVLWDDIELNDMTPAETAILERLSSVRTHLATMEDATDALSRLLDQAPVVLDQPAAVRGRDAGTVLEHVGSVGASHRAELELKRETLAMFTVGELDAEMLAQRWRTQPELAESENALAQDLANQLDALSSW